MTYFKPQQKYLPILIALLFAFSGCKSRHAEKQTESASEKSPVTTKKSEKPETERKEPPKREIPRRTKGDPEAFKKESTSYSVKLETSKGDVIIDVYEKLAPLAAERFKALVEKKFYDDAVFFRVIKGFVAQAGIAADPKVNAKWRSNRMKDDPVVQSNIKGTVSFASAGPNSRTTQFFINYKSNANLDGMGFAPFGVVRDMTPVEQFYSDYSRGRGPSQPRIQSQGNAYLKKEFPKLDYIKKATIIK